MKERWYRVAQFTEKGVCVNGPLDHIPKRSPDDLRVKREELDFGEIWYQRDELPIHHYRFVPHPSDQLCIQVLNVALSNKTLHSVAVPQHLYYRDIRSRLNNPTLWTWLSRPDDLRPRF